MIFGKEAVKGKKFSLTQHLGISLEDMQIVPYICEEEVQKGDIYLLCSDGLTDMVEMEEVHHILKGNIELKEKITKLEEKAMENGGKDNITIIGIEVV